MKTKCLLVLALIAFIGFSCKKEVENMDHKTIYGNPTSYLLKSQVWTGPTSNGGGYFYEYNKDNLVSKIARHQWGTFSVNGGPVQRWDDTTYYHFEYTNGLCSKWKFLDEGKVTGYHTYEYNDQKLPVKRFSYTANNILYSCTYFKYDNRNNLIEKLDSVTKVNSRVNLTYNQNNNLTSITDQFYQTQQPEKSKYEYLSHDNKVNFIKAVNGLPITGESNLPSYSSSSPNNYLSNYYYSSVDINQAFGSPNYMPYSYEYNDEGLPTKMRYASWLVTFEYEKYK